jgi:hypothetical protein
MKLTKQKLILLTKKNIELLGYWYVTDSVTGAQGLYIKKVNDSLFLSLGLTISRYYYSMFTATFYLSKTTTWSATWGDIPSISYKRVGHFLTQEEREKLLDEQESKPGMKDAWWNSNSDLNNFFEAVAIAESRFLNQPGLYDSVQKSIEINKMESLVKKVINMINEDTFSNEYVYRFTPAKSIDKIPIDWFKAAERVIENQGDILNANTVKFLATDAYRQSLFS